MPTEMTPDTITETIIEGYIQPSFTYSVDFENNIINGTVDGEQALNQSIINILSTPRYAYEIYDGNYGHELNTIIGKPYELVVAELPRLISEALLQDDRIKSVTNFRFERLSIDSMVVVFTVDSVYNKFDFGMEVSI